jgi:replicative DNA helicase
MGLTAFCLNQVNTLLQSIQKDEVIVYVTDKDSATVLIQRLLAVATQIELTNIQNGNLKEQEVAQIASHPITKHLESNRLLFLTNSNPTLFQIRSLVFNQLKEGKKPKMLFIDCLQSIIDRGRDRSLDITNVMLDINLLSQEYKVPVLCTISLRNRMVEYRESKFPRLTDLDSRLVNEVERVFFLIRPDYYEIIDLPSDDTGELHLIIAKNEGPLDILKLKMNRKNLSISEDTDTFPYTQI